MRYTANTMKRYDDYSREELLKLVEKQESELASKKYGLVWDKEREPEQVVLDCDTHFPVLKRIKGKALHTDDSDDNMLIEGDNYHALTVLNYTHKESIDVIYIDPPYNTGNKDFKYNDRFVDKEDGFRHSKWLNFMEKRLHLAKDLLKNTGVIFISIDDNEQAQLKLLCDRVFGEENFVATFPWRKRTAKSDVPFGVSQDFESIVCFCKKDFLAGLEHERRYYQTDDYPNDRWRLSDLTTQKVEADRPNSAFDLIDPKTGKVYPYNPKRLWGITKDTFQEYYKKGKIVFPGDYPFLKINNPAYRVFESEDKKKAKSKYGIEKQIGSVSTQLPKEIGMSENGNKEISEIFDERVFSFPKPKTLVQYLIKIGSLKSGKDSLILDFFAGSGTTGHAVLELNKEDEGNRTFILCTNNENNICEEVTYPRLQKVIKGYKKHGKGEKVAGLGGNVQYFKTDLVKKTQNRVQTRIDLTHKCTEMLCVKENIFNHIVEGEDYNIFASHKNDRFLCVYYNYLERSFADFLKEMQKLKGKKCVYMFSPDGDVDPELFVGVPDVTIEAIPQKILEVYTRLVKMHIPIKAETIFLECEKARMRIFDQKEKDEGARTLRVVLEKTLQSVAQKHGVGIFSEKHREEKVARLNDALKEKGVFGKVLWEENKTYLAIGNHASHGDYDAYDLQQVERFYHHVQSLHTNFLL
jgi:adenine-specific DNA-methyltransferase